MITPCGLVALLLTNSKRLAENSEAGFPSPRDPLCGVNLKPDMPLLISAEYASASFKGALGMCFLGPQALLALRFLLVY